MSTSGSMTTGWYGLKQGAGADARTGPHTWEELYNLTLTGALQPADLAWNPELPEWLPAAQIPGLFGQAAGAAVAAAPTGAYAPPSSSEGTTGGMSGVVSKQDDRVVIEGTVTSSGKGFSIMAVWTVTQ